nr:DEAD/DEAH box helicase family protein [Heliobacterium chlorum]
MTELLRLLHRNGIGYQIVDLRASPEPVEFGSLIQLRDYQAPAVKAMLEATQGILQACAGAGKTEMFLQIIAESKLPTLCLTHNKDLAKQIIDRACGTSTRPAKLSIPREEIGIIGMGKERIGPRLTIGIFQKMVRMDLSRLKGKFGQVIVDEVHHTSCQTWQTVLNQLDTKRRYGVTATFKRGDGLEVITERVIGPTLHKIPRSVVEAAGGVMKARLEKIELRFRSVVWDHQQEKLKRWEEACKAQEIPNAERVLQGLSPLPKPRKPVIDHNALISDVLGNEERNVFIARILGTLGFGHSSLVLTSRIEHGYRMVQLLREMCPDLRAAVVHGNTKEWPMPDKVREAIIAAMDQGELDMLFAVNLGKEGLDVPRLDQLFFVSGGRDEIMVEQTVGRIQRTFPGKGQPVVYDFVDTEIGTLANQFWARRRVYKELGII